MKYGVWLGLLVAGLAQAGEVSVSGEDFFGELPVVLTASRLRQPISEAPNAMTVIDRKMIEASGLRDLTDIFKLVPGMYVGYYKGHQGFVSYHGSPDQYARRMQVMIDGRSVYLPPIGMVDWSTLPISIEDIERIEVIRGPAAASHGANSTQGVISIITRDAGMLDGRRVTVTRGGKGVNDVYAHFGNRGEQLDYRMTLGYTADNGYDNLLFPPNGLSVPDAANAGILNNSHDNNQARLVDYRASYQWSPVDLFDVKAGFNHNVKEVGWTDAGMNLVHGLNSNAGHIQIDWIRSLGGADELKLGYYHVRLDQKEDFACAVGNVDFGGKCFQAVNVNRDNLEVQHTLSLSESNRLVYGAAFRNDQVDGKGSNWKLLAMGQNYVTSSAFDISEWRVFAHDEWRLSGKTLLNLGGQLERDGFGNRHFSPRMAVNFHALPGHTLRAGYSVAYRTPSLMESNFPQPQPGELFIVKPLPSVVLPSERLASREIGYVADLRNWNTSLDMRIYSDLLDNGIFQHGGVFANGLSVEYRGFETTMKHAFGDDHDLTLNYAYATARSNGPELAAAGFGKLQAASSCRGNADVVSCSIPRHSASLQYSKRLSRDLSLSTTMYFQGAMQPQDRPWFDYQYIQRRADMRLAKGLREIGGIRADIALVVQNLFDQSYTDYVANSLNKRRALVTVGAEW